MRDMKDALLIHPDDLQLSISATKNEEPAEDVSAYTTKIHQDALRKEVGERRQREQVLLESKTRYKTILESIEDSYFEVDLSGDMTSVSYTHLRAHET